MCDWMAASIHYTWLNVAEKLSLNECGGGIVTHVSVLVWIVTMDKMEMDLFGGNRRVT